MREICTRANNECGVFFTTLIEMIEKLGGVEIAKKL